MEPFDPGAFSGTVPIFPLPNVVLLPHGLLPLHVFEPRYRAMARAALSGERLIGMALLKPGWEPEYYGDPPVHEIVGVGRVIQDAELPDGKFNLVLCGVARMRILEEVQREPFRAARVEVLEDREAQGKGYERKRRLLLAFYRQVLTQLLKEPSTVPPDDLPLGPLCDLLGSVLEIGLPVKQALLEELDIASRCDRLVDLLRSAKAPGFGGDAGGRRLWPPAPSSN